MKTFLMNLILQRGLILLLTATTSQASVMSDVLKKTFNANAVYAQGGMNGGGGRAVVCRNKDNSIKSAELLDLYEAKTIYGLTLRSPRKTFEEDRSFAFKKMLIHFSSDQKENENDLKESIELFDENTTYISYPNKLKQVNDSEEPVVPEDCSIEQVAHFYEDDKLIVQKEIYDAFDILSKSALFVHEGTFYMARSIRNDATSRQSRKFVGLFYSTKVLTPIHQEYHRLQVEKGNIQCNSMSSDNELAENIELILKKDSDDSIHYEIGAAFDSLFYKINSTNNKSNSNLFFYNRVYQMIEMQPAESKIDNQEFINSIFYADFNYNYEFSNKFSGEKNLILSAKRVKDPLNDKYFLNEFKATQYDFSGKTKVVDLHCFITQ